MLNQLFSTGANFVDLIGSLARCVLYASLDPGFVRSWDWPNLASSLVKKDAHVILYTSMKTSATMHELFLVT